MSSNTFTYNNITSDLVDIPDVNNYPERIIQIRNASTKAIIRQNVGRIYPLSGIVKLNGIIIESKAPILIFVTPNSNDIAPKFNQVINIEFNEIPGVTVTGEEDLIASLGAQGAALYTTFNRHG
tara:strand:- start:91 stop:462 length:372 start_codon:yes stop_codon:yes gene_type:complete